MYPGLSGETNWEKATHDMLVEGLRDIMAHVIPAVILETDEEKKVFLEEFFVELIFLCL